MKIFKPAPRDVDMAVTLLIKAVPELTSGLLLAAIKAHSADNASATQLPLTTPLRSVTRAEAASRLAVSTRTIDRLIRDGHLRRIRVGTRSSRIPEGELDRLVLNGLD